MPNGMTSDSGAGDTVGPEEDYPGYPVEESPGSKKGLYYVAAGGAKLKNTGQKRVLIMTREGQLKWVIVQMAKVKKTLSSVSRSNDNNYDVVYSSSGSYMEDCSNGDITKLRRQRGVFVLDAWVVPYKMAMTGKVSFTDIKGKRKTINVGPNTKSKDFMKPAR